MDMAASSIELNVGTLLPLLIVGKIKQFRSIAPANKRPRQRWLTGPLVHQALALLGVSRRSLFTVRQAVDVGGKQVDLVVTLQIGLGRHLALATVTDGLL
jgi:hypothetical protein